MDMTYFYSPDFKCLTAFFLSFYHYDHISIFIIKGWKQFCWSNQVFYERDSSLGCEQEFRPTISHYKYIYFEKCKF